MSDKEDNSTLLFILSGIQESIRSVEEKIDDRWDRALNELASQKEQIQQLQREVEHTTKVVSLGNGKPSIVSQVFQLQKDMNDVKETTEETLKEVNALTNAVSAPTPQEVRVHRLKVIGLFLGLLTAAVPGVLALLS